MKDKIFISARWLVLHAAFGYLVWLALFNNVQGADNVVQFILVGYAIVSFVAALACMLAGKELYPDLQKLVMTQRQPLWFNIAFYTIVMSMFAWRGGTYLLSATETLVIFGCTCILRYFGEFYAVRLARRRLNGDDVY